MKLQLLLLCLLATTLKLSSSLQFLSLRNTHNPKLLSDDEILFLSSLSNTTHVEEVLDNILIPRVVGTPNHDKVLKYIVRELKKLNWHVELDEFEEQTPNFGVLPFQNIIATLNPHAERFLVLACHYDSKYFAEEEFVGATDSAVPCAMMLNLATVMKDQLASIRNNNHLSLKLVFFDGEEAFQTWGPRDSIYGARHLANKYHNARTSIRSTGETVSDLHRIDVLVLLDLLGAPDPVFYSFFKDTERWYIRLTSAEDCLSNFGEFKKTSYSPHQTYFQKRSTSSFIEDDHIPFLKRRVPILHIIPTPFPKQWHTPADNRDAIDINTVENLNKIFRIFVAEYLHLSLDIEDDSSAANIPDKEL